MKLKIQLLHFLFLLIRPMTLGVRVIVINGSNEVLLVRHTYVTGWHLPGGGVERGMTCEQTARKEVREEAYISLDGSLELLSVHANQRASKRDHVAVYRCTNWSFIKPFTPNFEIAETGFFPLENLPDGITEPTRQRLSEAFDGEPTNEFW